MGYKNVCTNCRKAFNQGTDFSNISQGICPECGEKMHLVNHNFKPPNKNYLKKWIVVKLLIENGFKYQHIYNSENEYVVYPDNLIEAKNFIECYKSQSYKL